MTPPANDTADPTSLLSLVEQLPDCLIQIQLADGEVTFLSDNIKSLTGQSASEFRHVLDLLQLDPDTSIVDWKSLFQKEFLDYEWEVATRFGARRWLNLRGRVNETRDSFSGVICDITERIEEQRLSATLMDSIAVSGQEIFVFDVYSHVLLYANSTAQANLYYRLEDLQKKNLHEFYRGGSERLVEVIATIKSVGPHESRHVLKRQDGSEYDLVANSILQGPDQSQLVFVGRDHTSINRLRRMEDEIRDRYRRALKGSETDIWEWDIRNDRFTSTTAVARWLGIPPEDVSGDGEVAMRHVHPADRDRVEQVISDAIFGSSLEYFNEYRLVASNSEVIWIQARGKVQRDEKGRATMLSGTTTNITERKQAQKDLQNQISTLAAVLDNIADGIIAVNADGVVTMINPKAVSILRRTRQELLGSTVLQHFKLQGLELRSWSSVADGAMREAELKNGHGRVVPIEFAVSEARLVEQSLHIVVFRDIEGRKRFEKEILYAKERAEVAAKAKTDFLATMSHEIRTPMNGILGMAQLLLDTGLNPEQYETARVIHSSGEALLTIINDILDFSKIDAGKLEVESELFDLRTAIGDVLEIVQNKANDRSVPLLVDYPLELPHRIFGDAGRVKQVLLNLIGNAVKFTEHGSITISVRPVEMVSARNLQWFEFSVQDTGIGIPAEMHDQLFESFRQADASTTRRYGGTGLGLAICKQLVELMGGEIGLESQPKVGTRFWFRVSFPVDDVQYNPILSDRFSGQSAVVYHPNPAVSENLAAKLAQMDLQVETFKTFDELFSISGRRNVVGFICDSVAPERVRELETSHPELHPILLTSIGSKQKQQHQMGGLERHLNLPIDDRQLIAQLHRGSDETPIVEPERPKTDQEVFSGLNILLAEDNIVNQKVIARMLTKQGCRVDVAENGLDAVNMSEANDYDLIFMDLRMPEKDGIEAVMDIRRRELQQNANRIPIVAMTANAMGGDRDACLDAGMDDYVSKPVQIATLTEVLERWATSS